MGAKELVEALKKRFPDKMKMTKVDFDVYEVHPDVIKFLREREEFEELSKNVHMFFKC